MNQRQRFIRKIVYACVIAALLLPLSWLSQPETTETERRRAGPDAQRAPTQPGPVGRDRPGQRNDQAGHAGHARRGRQHPVGQGQRLSRRPRTGSAIRPRSNKSPSCSPTSSASGSFRAGTCPTTSRSSSTTTTIAITGSSRASTFSRKAPSTTATSRGCCRKSAGRSRNKIGRADEHVQFRRLFREDDDFNGSRPLAQRDNWLVGRDWLLKAEQLVDQGHAGPRRSAAVVLLAPGDVPGQLCRGSGRGRHVRRSGQERLEEGRRRLDRTFQPRPAHLVERFHSFGR